MTQAAAMTAGELIALANASGAGAGCPRCSALVCRGWESMPGGFDRSNLRCVGTLRAPGDDDPTLAEFHPAGTHGWSDSAPIAPGWFPYNRCDVWQCEGCARPFLRYTEYGGYYTDERIREVRAHLVVNPPPGTAPT
ncbi:hypothetical protein [Rhizobacter sp. Root1221]|uniref:hypothetical protein n=1 Tax=Rhizobacter sp. Root1221 TaxID=1736433 RepID=UPI0006FDA98D|nr:hypothetical protein [Rhizobacter sp. Root1221]KQW00082.1 hypothetical protein ASC87_18855 [Rhizobacter sp. Root1221]